jgi:hypothetical protein
LKVSIGCSDYVFEERTRKIAARVVADKFAHPPPRFPPALTADMGRHQHVGEIPERARRGQRFFGEGVEAGASP